MSLATMTSTTACPTCSGPVHPLVRAGGVDFALCDACQVAFWDPMPTEAELSRIYEGERYYGRTRGGDEHRPSYLHEAYREEVWRSSEERLALLPAGMKGRMLDIGCGTGEFLARARERGFDVEGLEVQAFAAEAARARYGLTVHVGTVESAALPAGRFDVVSLFHVLEHLRDPVRFLSASVRPLLSDDGFLLLEVPNLDSLDFWLLRDRWLHLSPGEHVWQFTRDGLARMLARSGFEVLDRRTPHGPWSVSKLLRYLGLSQGLIARLKRASALPVQSGPATGRVASWPVEVGRRAITALTWPIGGPLVALIEALGRGERLLVVARKASR